MLKLVYESLLANGYEATRTIDIAKEAGIGKGTIYEYFRSKEEIIEAILDSFRAMIEEALKLSARDWDSIAKSLNGLRN